MTSRALQPALIVGGDSVIGQALAARLPDALVTTRRTAGTGVRLDLNDRPEDWTLPTDIGVVYLCAGITAVRACEDDPEGTARINVDAMSALATRLSAAGARIVYPSTNMVFDGDTPQPDETASPNPRTAYGRQKADAEARIAALNGPTAIVRLTKVVPPAFPLFWGWLDALKAGNTITPFADVVTAPLALDVVVDTLIAAGTQTDVPAIVHASPTDDISYAAMARWLGERLGTPPERIEPVAFRAQNPEASPPPRHVALGCRASAARLGFSPPPPLDAVEACFSAWWQRQAFTKP